MEDKIKERIDVGIAELIVIHNPTVLIARGLGSCVAVSLRDPVARIGALAHVVLPSIEQSNNKGNPLRFADYAIEIAVEKMLEMGCSKNRISAKIAGGACMFHFENQTINIGKKNVEAVTQKLEEMHIPLLASDTGGNHGRTVEFDIEVGRLTIKSALHGVKEI